MYYWYLTITTIFILTYRLMNHNEPPIDTLVFFSFCIENYRSPSNSAMKLVCRSIFYPWLTPTIPTIRTLIQLSIDYVIASHISRVIINSNGSSLLTSSKAVIWWPPLIDLIRITECTNGVLRTGHQLFVATLTLNRSPVKVSVPRRLQWLILIRRRRPVYYPLGVHAPALLKPTAVAIERYSWQRKPRAPSHKLIVGCSERMQHLSAHVVSHVKNPLRCRGEKDSCVFRYVNNAVFG